MPTPDNLNTAYLGQLQGNDNLNTPFLPETASEATINKRSDVSLAGDLFVTGVTTLSDALNSASAISGGALTVTTIVASGTIDTDSALSAGEGTFTGGNFSSVITSTDGGGDFGSIATAANDTGMPDGAFRFINAASGSASAISLAYRSGGTTYYIGSTLSEA